MVVWTGRASLGDCGRPPEIVRGKVRDSEALETWDHRPAIRASRATEIRDEFVALRDENDRMNRERIGRQLDAERDGRMWPVTAYGTRSGVH